MGYNINQSTNRERHEATSLHEISHETGGRGKPSVQHLQKDRAGRWLCSLRRSIPGRGTSGPFMSAGCSCLGPKPLLVVTHFYLCSRLWCPDHQLSAVKSFHSPRRSSGGLAPLLSAALGSMSHPPRLRGSLILLIPSLDPGSQNVSPAPFIPFFTWNHQHTLGGTLSILSPSISHFLEHKEKLTPKG